MCDYNSCEIRNEADTCYVMMSNIAHHVGPIAVHNLCVNSTSVLIPCIFSDADSSFIRTRDIAYDGV